MPENCVYWVCVQDVSNGGLGSYRGGFCAKVSEASSESKRAKTTRVECEEEGAAETKMN